jgi:hypothetical protein
VNETNNGGAEEKHEKPVRGKVGKEEVPQFTLNL